MLTGRRAGAMKADVWVPTASSRRGGTCCLGVISNSRNQQPHRAVPRL